ncbi:MAG: 50S ribosomal protein L10 [Gammaproteobacteria bacterium]|nr:50S ribosomal protein L10 [Gammaproteobacteria bacterium]MCY4210653.1 50S ribosomal protein L10 [Gammaproteobacteria bacterium]MCY4283428.1 50S ribosomal protein L10 [Gammaproteobacteria bacterium]MCY4337291.1 50S ribosomal protein L10 [Gammaproteobacteria bacterium]
MALTLEQKQAIVAEVAAIAATAPAAIAAEYTGLNVAKMTALRRSAREAGIYLKVVRNTLARRAFEGTQFDCMSSTLSGPLLLAFSNAEPGSAAKVIRDFAQDNEQLVVRLIALDGRLLDATEIENVANMPSLDQARATLLGLLQAPLGKFLRVLSEPEGKFLRVLDARREQLTK